MLNDGLSIMKKINEKNIIESSDDPLNASSRISGNGKKHSFDWRDLNTYGAVLVREFLSPLEAAARKFGVVPANLQANVLFDLQAYFATDMQERAPTVVVREENAVRFHELIGRIMNCISVESILSLDRQGFPVEVMHAFLSYKNPESYSCIAIDAYDPDQELVRLTYYVHGNKPTELFLVNGQEVRPAFAKYRACNFFRRTLFRQRIVWLPICEAKILRVSLDGELASISLGNQNRLADQISWTSIGDTQLKQMRRLPLPSRGSLQPIPNNLHGIKARILRRLARIPVIRRKYKKAWVFADREGDADDNAEHMYRWVMEHHPEINLFFFLSSSSPDWSRLNREGFRLVDEGLRRKLILLNCENIVSSHTDYKNGKLDRERYGDLMNWRFSFLQHGVIKDDLSHWLSDQPFDLFITTGPFEYGSLIDDDTPYTYTNREVCRTGLPRHDRLLRIANNLGPLEVDTLLIMPTWRGGLVDGRISGGSNQDPISEFAKSEYAQHWRTLLNSKKLHDMALRFKKNIVFMPHQNAVPYIQAFDPPSYVRIATSAGSKIQELFARTSGFITDYTSVAFTMAFLRRMVFYYQFDRDGFYHGDHNWREGYFNYEQDGFGPVTMNQEQLLDEVEGFLANNSQPAQEYLDRMTRAIPEVDDLSCQRVYDSILAMRQPFSAD